MNINKVRSIIDDFIPIAKRENELELISTIKTKLHFLNVGILRVVVVGEIKKGKSSFINALLGEEDFLPVLSDVATSTVFKVIYGEEKQVKVFFKSVDNEEHASEPLSIPEDQIMDYGTEDGNPNNAKNVDFIAIQLPNELLKQGLVLIDTPGLGGIFRKHKEITWRYLPNADAVFFVLESVESVATKEEMNMLTHIIKLTPAIFFVQTKIDLVNKELWQKWAHRNKEIISEHLSVPADKLVYFPVSAKLKNIADNEHSIKYLERSGFKNLLEFINFKLVPKKENDFARNILSLIYPYSAELHKHKINLLKLTLVDNTEQLEKLQEEFKKARINLDKWKSETWVNITKETEDELQIIIRNTRDAYIDRLDPSPSSYIVANKIKEVKQSYNDSSEILSNSDEIISECKEDCFNIVHEIHNNYNSDLRILFQSINDKFKESVVEITEGSILKELIINSENTLDSDISNFETLKTASYGGMLGYGVGSAGIAITSMLIPPLAAVAGIAAIAITIFGAMKNVEIQEEKKKEQLLNQLKNILTDTVRKVQSKSLRQFDTIAQDDRRRVSEQMKKMLAKVESDFKEKAKAINSRTTDTKKETEEKVSQLKKEIDELNNILSDIIKVSKVKQDVI